MLVQRTLWPLTRIGEVLDDFERAKSSAARTFGLLGRQPTIKDPESPKSFSDSPLARSNNDEAYGGGDVTFPRKQAAAAAAKKNGSKRPGGAVFEQTKKKNGESDEGNNHIAEVASHLTKKSKATPAAATTGVVSVNGGVQSSNNDRINNNSVNNGGGARALGAIHFNDVHFSYHSNDGAAVGGASAFVTFTCVLCTLRTQILMIKCNFTH
jgi:ABC-type multidrug transport system fused ATPase/permease subunit